MSLPAGRWSVPVDVARAQTLSAGQSKCTYIRIGCCQYSGTFCDVFVSIVHCNRMISVHCDTVCRTVVLAQPHEGAACRGRSMVWNSVYEVNWLFCVVNSLQNINWSPWEWSYWAKKCNRVQQVAIYSKNRIARTVQMSESVIYICCCVFFTTGFLFVLIVCVVTLWITAEGF